MAASAPASSPMAAPRYEPVRMPEAQPAHVGAFTAMAAMAEHEQMQARPLQQYSEPRVMPGRNEALAMATDERPFIAPRPIEAPLRPEPVGAGPEPAISRQEAPQGQRDSNRHPPRVRAEATSSVV